MNTGVSQLVAGIAGRLGKDDMDHVHAELGYDVSLTRQAVPETASALQAAIRVNQATFAANIQRQTYNENHKRLLAVL